MFIVACGRSNTNNDTDTNSDSYTKSIAAIKKAVTEGKQFEVLEIIQTSKYTYLKVSENYGQRWVAVSKTDAVVGDKYYYDKALPMKNFWSKELERNFESVDFINHISKTPMTSDVSSASAMMNPHGHSGKVKEVQLPEVSVPKSGSELTIAQIFSNPQNFANNEVDIKGMVTKVNKNIMGRNWIHIQDGTRYNNSFDLTITSSQMPELNQIVSFKGLVHLNKDFGSGYFYDVIMEDAVLK